VERCPIVLIGLTTVERTEHMRLENRVALITGAGRGIGAATVRKLATEGAAIVIADLDLGPADEVAAAIRGAGGRAIAVACDAANREQVEATVERAAGERRALCVMVADTDQERERGLMGVTDLAGYDGMVFVWTEDSTSSFYMRNTPTPLSIGWFDAEGAFVSDADMDPCGDVEGCTLYSATGPYRFAVEVPQGELDRLGVGEGSRLALGGRCA
jgi:uncharacterized membrane protein (UPF0127 family)